MIDPDIQFDIFISHATEDKTAIARPLADQLERHGLRVWIDEAVLQPGASLSGSIDAGLARARYGVVILSPRFFSKNWPKYELAGLKARQLNGEQIILPVWHEVTIDDVIKFSPPLADMLAYDSAKLSAEEIAEGILHTVNPQDHSRWFIQTARHALQNLDRTEFHGTSFDYWPDGGLRSVYEHLLTFSSYAQLVLHCPHEIWIKGPHSRQRLDLNNHFDFGFYNPAFVVWLRANLRFVLQNAAFVRATQPLVERFLLPLIRVYYTAFELLRANPSVTDLLTNGLRDGIATRRLDPQHYWGISWLSGAANADTLVGRLMDRIGDPNVGSSAVYFWIRRLIDGTSETFHQIVVDLFTTYSPADYTNLNSFTKWDLSIAK